MESWLTKAAKSKPEQMGTGTSDGSLNTAPGASFPGESQLFLPDGGTNVHQTKQRKKRRSRSQERERELQPLRWSDPRGIQNRML